MTVLYLVSFKQHVASYLHTTSQKFVELRGLSVKVEAANAFGGCRGLPMARHRSTTKSMDNFQVHLTLQNHVVF